MRKQGKLARPQAARAPRAAKRLRLLKLDNTFVSYLIDGAVDTTYRIDFQVA
jgi:hypothetical protein